MKKTHVTKIKSVYNQIKLITAGCLIMLVGSTGVLADGLPGEYYVTQRWRDFFAGHSPATNPAFMTEENYLSLRLAISPTLQNTFTLMEMGIIKPIGFYHSLGFTYLGLNATEDLEMSHYDYGNDEIVYDNKFINDNQSLYSISYAVNPFGRISFGLNTNIYHKSNFDSSITGASIDFAMSLRLLHHPILGEHLFGINLQNILSPNFQFSNWTNEAANMKISWLAKILEKRIEFGIDLDIKDFISQTEDFAHGAVTGDSPKEVEFDFNARLGVWLLNVMNIYVQAGSGYFGVCPGMNVPSLNNGRDLQIAYQFMSVVDDIRENTSHTFYFRGDFGKHREEIYARRMAKQASLGPTVLYNKARKLYSEGKSWEAFFLFGKILVEYPDFFKNDWVQLHMGLCQENLDMRKSATENFAKTKKDFPRSKVASYADFGLLRINYRDNNRLGVVNQFAKLNTSSTPDSLKWHAHYYMAQQHMRDKKLNKAISLLSKIPAEHPEYAFAQFSLATSQVSKGNIGLAMNTLENIIQYTPKTKEAQEIVNRALTFIGYILFEGIDPVDQSLQQAVAALRKVPVTSYYYVDAQLGLAWAALKASQWADCQQSCNEIVRVSKNKALTSEALLLKGYVDMVNKRYAEALTSMNQASNLIAQAKAPSVQEKEAATVAYGSDRVAYDDIAVVMNDLGYSGQSSFIISKIDSLSTPQQQVEKSIKGYHTYIDEFHRASFFAKPISKLREDIDYALAKAEKFAGEGKSIKIKDSAGEQIDKIDDQMEKLKKELENLEGKNK